MGVVSPLGSINRVSIRKNFLFSTFNESKGEGGTTYRNFFSTCNSLGSQLSLEVALSPPSGEKIDILAEKMSFLA